MSRSLTPEELRQLNSNGSMLGPGIVMSMEMPNSRSGTPTLTPSPRQNGFNYNEQSYNTASRDQVQLLKDHSDTVELIKIFNILELPDQLLYHSISKGMSINEYKYHLSMRLSKKQ